MEIRINNGNNDENIFIQIIDTKRRRTVGQFCDSKNLLNLDFKEIENVINDLLKSLED